MGLALCHRVPRDIFVELALFFLIVSFILQAIVIGRHSSVTGVGYLAGRRGDVARETLGYIAAHPAIYAGAVRQMTKLCDPSNATLRYHCARFAESYHTVNGIMLACFISTVLSVIIGALFSTYMSTTTTGLLRRLLFFITLPASLLSAGLAIFYVRTVANGKADMLPAYALPANTKISFHRRHLVNLSIAAMVFLWVAVLLVFSRWTWAMLAHLGVLAAMTQQGVGRPSGNVPDVMQLHLINDDWERQKQILRSHAKSVQLDLQFKETAMKGWPRGRHHDHGAHEDVGVEQGFAFTRQSTANSPLGPVGSQCAMTPVTLPTPRQLTLSDIQRQQSAPICPAPVSPPPEPGMTTTNVLAAFRIDRESAGQADASDTNTALAAAIIAAAPAPPTSTMSDADSTAATARDSAATQLAQEQPRL